MPLILLCAVQSCPVHVVLKLMPSSNHPIIKEDGLLAVFLTEPSFETWRKHSAVTLEEESVSKRVDRIEEMSIPSDLEDKLACGLALILTSRMTSDLFLSQVCERQNKPPHRAMAKDLHLS